MNFPFFIGARRRLPIPWPVWLGLAFAILTVGYPIGMLFLQSVFPEVGRGRMDEALSPYLELMRTEGVAVMWRNSLTCAAMTTLLSWVLGLPAGWLLARARMPGKSFLRASLLLPVMSPPYLLALAYVLLFQSHGLADCWVGKMPEGIRHVFFSFWGVVLVMSLTSFGTVALLVETAVAGISPRMDDAARCLGASALSIFQRITFPILVPALVNAGVLVFIDTLSNFGIAAVLGPRSGLLLLPTAIYELLTTWPVNVPLAAAISSLLAITAMLVVSAARFVIGARVLTNGNSAAAGRLIHLRGFWGIAAWTFFGGLFLFSSALPNLTVFLMSIIDRWQGGRPSFTARHYRSILQFGGGGMEALSTSALLSFGAATACVLLGALIAYALSRYRGRGAAWLDQLSMLPRVIPNLVIAVALILAWNAPWAPVRVYGTLAMLLLAYVAIYQAIGLRFADVSIQQIAPRLEQAAACLGAPRASIMGRIVFPMLAPGLSLAWITIFIMCLRDWVASIMLLPPGAQTVGSFIFSQFEQGDFSQAMAMSFFTVVLSSILLVAANQRFYRRIPPPA